ncbi:MAG: hypothetical protein K0S86_2830, partial [Geminicoccaceae bacterium]|nr:hypothetical protein [Geminicoccaceae bacterium]
MHRHARNSRVGLVPTYARLVLLFIVAAALIPSATASTVAGRTAASDPV